MNPIRFGGRTPKAHRHAWAETLEGQSIVPGGYFTLKCTLCGKVDDGSRLRGKQARNYGNRAELEAARRYGGVKVGHGGGPADIRSSQWLTQMKTHRRLPPIEWTKAFAKLSASTDRPHRLLLRFVLGPGQAPVDFFVVRGDDWLAWFGRDDDERL